jgi:hypothetical protein
MTDSARTGYAISKGGTGRYTVTMNAAHPDGANFAIFPSVRGNFMATYGTPLSSATVFDVYTYAFGGGHADAADFAFFTIP